MSPMNLDLAGDQCVWLPTDLLWQPNDPEIPLEAIRLIEDDNWCVQVKEDGNHVLAARTAERVTTRNRRGEPHPIAKLVESEIAKLAPGSMLDGEKLHTSASFIVFDALYLNDNDLRMKPYAERFELAMEICKMFNPAVIRPVQTAWTTDEKLELVGELKRTNAEGAVFKDLRATYRPGRPAFGGTMRRLKFRKSLTCLVRRRSANDKNQKASFDMFVMGPDGQPRNIGEVSSQQFHNQLQPEEARIAEVSYLYASPKYKLTQPTLVRPMPWRTDKSFTDCTLDQLVIGGRFARVEP